MLWTTTTWSFLTSWIIQAVFSEVKSGLAILHGPGFPTPGEPGLGNNAFLVKVGNNGQ